MAEAAGEGVLRGGPRGVAFAQARMLARVGKSSSSELLEEGVVTGRLPLTFDVPLVGTGERFSCRPLEDVKTASG